MDDDQQGKQDGAFFGAAVEGKMPPKMAGPMA